MWAADSPGAATTRELVPGVEVKEVLPAFDDPAVLEREDDAAVDVQTLAVTFCAVVMKADDPTVVALEHVEQGGPEGPVSLHPVPAELAKDRITAVVIARKGAASGRVPNRARVEEFGQRRHVGRVKGLVSAPHEGRVALRGSAHDSSLVA